MIHMSSDWIKVSSWESSQESWSKTNQVLLYHQNLLNSILNNDRTESQNANHINSNYEVNDADSWMTNDIRNCQGPVQIKLLCGADLLQSFGVPGLWAETDIERIVSQHGLVVISRQGYDPYRFIYESDILTRNQNNIIVINEWVTNDISSTKIRRALRRQESVKYLIEDSVIHFIRKHGLYGCMKNDL
ncbi:UNVERIFIED_CONTAM: hypothetical protein PYX00_004727 [Menopon gallinae]|uniref:Nicotinamide/nicotinic acid mononucleotide adenylyltransferase 3 n=1 Tax=Menopon gallinae TaxID=328185 RepID=A0AAW2I516_9NEOP